MKISEGELMATFCGSPHYASPEIMKEKRYIGPEVDVWSLGVLLYTMCTGLFPWDGETLAEVMRNAVRARYVVPEFLSNDCKSIIGRMLEPETTKRATLEEIRVHPWLNDGLRIPQHIAKRKKVTQIDEHIFKKLRDFGLNEEEARKNILGNQFTSQAFVLYSLIEEYIEKQKEEAKQIPKVTAVVAERGRTSQSSTRTRTGSAGPLTLPQLQHDGKQNQSVPASPIVDKKEKEKEKDKEKDKDKGSKPQKQGGLLNRFLKRRDSDTGSFFSRKRSNSNIANEQSKTTESSVVSSRHSDGADSLPSPTPTVQGSPVAQKKLSSHFKTNSEDLGNNQPKIENKIVKKIMYE